VSLSGDGSFSYDPFDDLCGVDGFDYQVSDGLFTSAIATVSINVSCVNDTPVITATGANLSE
jgi:hypothetical protein